jgi:hypothetical protein
MAITGSPARTAALAAALVRLSRDQMAADQIKHEAAGR